MVFQPHNIISHCFRSAMANYSEATLNITIALLIGSISYLPSAAAINSSLLSLATPKTLKIAWILKPPYTELIANQTSVNEAHGMFRDVLLRFFVVECGFLHRDPTDYTVDNLKVDSEFEMIELLRQSNVHVVFPIFEHPFHRRFSEFLFLKVDDYPGTEFITTEDHSSALDVVMDAVLKAWPLLAVNIVFSAIRQYYTLIWPFCYFIKLYNIVN